MPTLMARLSEYMVEPYGTPPDRSSTRSIVYESSVTIRPRPAPPTTDRIRTYYKSSSRDSVEHQLVGWLIDTPVVQYLENLGSYFATAKQTETTIVSQFGCSPRAIMLSDRAEDPLWSAATVALTILGLFALGLFGVPLARPVAMIMLFGYLSAWLGHAYGTSSFCFPAIATAAPVDLLDIINRYTPAAHVHSLMLEQLTEGTSYDSPDDSPAERCRKLGFENSIDSLIYLLSTELQEAEEWAKSSGSIAASFVRSTLIGKSLSRFSVLNDASPSIKSLYRICWYMTIPSLLMLIVAIILALILGITIVWALIVGIVEFGRFVSAYFSLMSYQLVKMSDKGE